MCVHEYVYVCVSESIHSVSRMVVSHLGFITAEKVIVVVECSTLLLLLLLLLMLLLQSTGLLLRLLVLLLCEGVSWLCGALRLRRVLLARCRQLLIVVAVA
jgi:hypothetical protein